MELSEIEETALVKFSNVMKTGHDVYNTAIRQLINFFKIETRDSLSGNDGVGLADLLNKAQGMADKKSSE